MERIVRIGVYGLALDADRILLTKLWDRGSAGGHWTLPGGGMEFGETPIETLEREFYEETGLYPEMGALLNVRSVMPRPNMQSIQVVYSVSASGVPRVIETGGSTVATAWIPLDDIDQLPLVGLVHHSLRLALDDRNTVSGSKPQPWGL